MAASASWVPEWAPGVQIELETRFESVDGGTRVTVELGGWDEAMESVAGPDERERVAWFAEHVAAALSRGAAPDALADWMTDRIARRPAGARAREIYRDPEMHKPGFRVVLDALHPRPDDHLLEIACGGGMLLAWALETGCRAIGLDHSEEMVRLASEQAPGADVVLGKAEALPFDDETFTCVASATAFFFFADPVACCARQGVCSAREAGWQSSRRRRSCAGRPQPPSRSRAADASTRTTSLRRSRGRPASWTRRLRARRTAANCSPLGSDDLHGR
jgi:hypothetical protein